MSVFALQASKPLPLILPPHAPRCLRGPEMSHHAVKILRRKAVVVQREDFRVYPFFILFSRDSCFHLERFDG